MSWFFGNESKQKISMLSAAYKRGRIKSANQKKSFLTLYHPVLGDRDIIELITEDEFLTLTKIKSPLVFDKKKLTVLKKYYESRKYLYSLYGVNRVYSVDEDIHEKFPETNSEFEEALEIIQKTSPWMHDIFTLLIEEICPIKFKGSFRFIGGASDYHLIGTVFTGLKPIGNQIIELAISLVHELAHNVLMLYQTGQYPIESKDFQKEVYSGVRKTNRPAIASLHAAIALGYMLTFCRDLKNTSFNSDSVQILLTQRIPEYEESLIQNLNALQNLSMNKIGAIALSELADLVNSSNSLLI